MDELSVETKSMIIRTQWVLRLTCQPPSLFSLCAVARGGPVIKTSVLRLKSECGNSDHIVLSICHLTSCETLHFSAWSWVICFVSFSKGKKYCSISCSVSPIFISAIHIEMFDNIVIYDFILHVRCDHKRLCCYINIIFSRHYFYKLINHHHLFSRLLHCGKEWSSDKQELSTARTPWGNPVQLSLTCSLPWCELKTTNKNAKFKLLTHLFVFRISI